MTTGSAAHAVTGPDRCGGVLSDYVGLAGLDSPFVGSVEVNNTNLLMSVAPQFLNSNLFTTQITSAAGALRSATSGAALQVDNLGYGKLTFSSYAGVGTGTAGCTTGTRVTSLTGSIPVVGQSKKQNFTVTRS